MSIKNETFAFVKEKYIHQHETLHTNTLHRLYARL